MRSRHLSATIAKLLLFLPAVAAFVAIASISHPATIFLALIGDALVIVAMADALGIRGSSSPANSRTTRTLTWLWLICVYNLLADVVVGYPLLWLLRDHSLGATLALSTLTVIALLGVWKMWPAFGLVCIRRRASSLAKILEDAQRLSSDNELYFSHGFAVSVSLLVLAVGAGASAGVGGIVAGTAKITATAIYAFAIVPIASLIVINRTANALLIDVKRRRAVSGESDRAEAAPVEPPEPIVEHVP